MKIACVFSHFDPDGVVDPYVHYYIEELAKLVSTLVFVSTSGLEADVVTDLEVSGATVILRENRGYDFFSYKVGLDSLDVSQFDEIILCNDSVYGPMLRLQDIFESMSTSEADAWAMTSSNEIAWHLQSYFLVFRKSVLMSSAFLRFWDNVVAVDSKRKIIRDYEVGLSKVLLESDFALGSYFEFPQDVGIRPWLADFRRSLRTLWRRRWQRSLYLDIADLMLGKSKIGTNPSLELDMVTNEDGKPMPFLKVQLLRENPKMGRDLWASVSRRYSQTGYPLQMIESHLARTSAGNTGISGSGER